ncbi:MAG: winged helix DNA-binding protein [Candidatus Aenigmatarchaeota archaeon]
MNPKITEREIVESTFLHPKPVKMLTVLKGDDVKYATQVSKAVDCTYSHTVKMLEMFRKMGLVTFEKKGRVKIIKLTGDGHDVAHDFEGIRRKFHRISGNVKEPLKEKSVKAK